MFAALLRERFVAAGLLRRSYAEDEHGARD
jgi:hypothetical protein